MAHPKIDWVPASDAIYFLFRDAPVSHSVEYAPDIIIDLDENGVVVGLDVQNVTQLIRESVQTTFGLLKDDEQGVKKPQLVLA